MIDCFETGVRIDSSKRLFTFVDRESRVLAYSYWEARLVAASLARKMRSCGLNAGDAVLVDLPNCPEFAFVALACAYGGLPMVLLDPALSEGEKLARRLEVERAGFRVAFRVDCQSARQMLGCVRQMPSDAGDIVRQIHWRPRHGRVTMGEGQDALDDTIHFAERAAHLFDRETSAVVVFADDGKCSEDGACSKARPVLLTWEKLMGAAQASIEFFDVRAVRRSQERLSYNSFSNACSGPTGGAGQSEVASWQCALPLHTITAFQMLVRAVMERSHLTIYEALDPEQLLSDVEHGYATHVALDDAPLQDLMTVEEWRCDVSPGASSRLALYKGVMLVGRTFSAQTVRRALDLQARLFVGYGMPQAAGEVAISRVGVDGGCGLLPLGGYEMCVIDQDEDGRGRLAVRGPGVFDGYLNSRTAFTVDRFFVTEDKALIRDGLVHIHDRDSSMFVSAGQSIYPVEIADVLRHVRGVSGVHVFGVPDSRCGMLPVAAIERRDLGLTPRHVEESTRSRFAGIKVPISIFMFDRLPRTELGKLDRPAIEAFFAC